MIVTVILFSTGCATKIHAPSDVQTPAKVKLGQFNSITFAPLVVASEVPRDGSNVRAIARIEEHIESQLAIVFDTVVFSETAEDAKNNSANTQLVAYTELVDLKFVSGGARFMVGAMAGSSAVIMRLKIVDTASGDIVAETSFYQKASAFSGPFGVADNKMLEVIVNDIRNYILISR